ncbi:MAG: hypothetical protein K940chlam6_00683 [Chlamydiae bacterium]|nr:hypothetical protein [Chlamydiota bacterium]
MKKEYVKDLVEKENLSKINFSKISIKELAGQIANTLEKAGINSDLVGGACVSIYSKNQYLSYDLDFVIYEDTKLVKKVLSEIGFKQKGRYFSHPKCPFFVEFVSPPLAIGNEPVKKIDSLKTPFGKIQLLTPQDCVKDRLASYFHWDDLQALDQAVLVYKKNKQKMVLGELKKWAEKEKGLEKYRLFLERIKA